MNKKDNKIKYNIKKAHYALQSEGEDGEISFDTPKPIPGAVSVAFDANGDIQKFYADGIVYYTSAANNGYEGDAEFALIPDSFRQDVLGEKKDAKGVLHEVDDSTASRRRNRMKEGRLSRTSRLRTLRFLRMLLSLWQSMQPKRKDWNFQKMFMNGWISLTLFLFM